MTTYYHVNGNDPYAVNPDNVDQTFWTLPQGFWGHGTYDAYYFQTPASNNRNYWVTADDGVDMNDYIETSNLHVDTIYGGLGNDYLTGQGHNDTYFGGNGNDTVEAADDDDTIYGDWSNFPNKTNGYTWNTPAEDASLTGDDQLYGGGGSDTIYGGAGNDQIDAGPRGGNSTDVVTGGDGGDAFLLSYDESGDSGTSAGDVWATYSQNFADFAAYDECQEVLANLAEEEVKEVFGSLGSTILLTGAGAALGTLADTAIDYLFAMSKSGTPKSVEDVLVIKDFNPSEDVIFLPLDDGVTLTEEVDYFTSAAASGVSGWGIKFNDGVSGTTYAEVFLDADYLTALGIADSSSSFTIDAIESVLATSMTITSSGIQNSDQVYALGDSDAIALAAPSGTSIEVFGAFGPLSIVAPAGSSKIVVGGTKMGDIITVNDQLVVPGDFTATAAYANTDRSLIRGFDGEDILYGGAGADEIYGDGGDDDLYGFVTTETSSGYESELLYGGDGNDLLSIGSSAASLDGGNGTDTVSFAYATTSAVTASLVTGLAYDGLGSASAANYTLTDVENLTGSSYADTLIGDDNGNVLQGGAGNDVIFGGAGDDTVDGGAGVDSLDGGNGADSLSFASSTSGVSVDLATGSASGDGAGDVTSGFEIIIGSGSADTLTGSTAGDSFYGGAGADHLYGGDGDDFLEGGGQADQLFGGNGNDTASYAQSGSGVQVDLLQQSENLDGAAAGDSLTGIETVLGSAYGDVLVGDNNGNSLNGSAGADHLLGEGGDDTLEGGSGQDSYVGGNGTDVVVQEDDHADYTLRIDSSDSDDYQITDGSDATDTLDWASIEYVRFADGLYSFSGSGTDVTLTEVTDSTTVNELDEGDAGENVATLTTMGSVALPSDVTDEPIEITPSGEDYLGQLEAVIGRGDRLDWTFSVPDADLDHLAAGETVTQSYITSVGGVERTITVTLVGAADPRGRAEFATDADDVLLGGNGDDRFFGLGGDDVLKGGGGADVILAASGDDVVTGGRGDDRLFGGAGNDAISGGNGNDLIYGGSGRDVMSGGDGNDLFVFQRGDWIDRIADFHAGRDLIDLSNYDVDEPLTFTDLTITTSSTQTVVEVGKLEIRLTDVTALGSEDFVF